MLENKVIPRYVFSKLSFQFYCCFITIHLIRIKELNNGTLDGVYYHQDGASAHTTQRVRDKLKEWFGEKIISLRSNFECAPRSPDLTPLDFYQWGVLRHRCFLSPLIKTRYTRTF